MSVQSFYETVHTLVEHASEYPAWESLPPEEVRRWTRMARLGGVVLTPEEIGYAWGVPAQQSTLSIEQIADRLDELSHALRALRADAPTLEPQAPKRRSARVRERLTTLLFYNPGATFLDTMLEPEVNMKNEVALIHRARGVALTRDAELIMARWDNPKMNVYLADTDTIYRGEEATQLFRKSYRIAADTKTRPTLSLSTKDS